MSVLNKNITNQIRTINNSINQPFTAALELQKYLNIDVLSQLAPLKKMHNENITEFSGILETLINNIVAFLTEYIQNSKKDINLIVSIKNLESMIKSQSSILGESRGLANQLSLMGKQASHDALTMQHQNPFYSQFQQGTQLQPEQIQLLQQLLHQKQQQQAGLTVPKAVATASSASSAPSASSAASPTTALPSKLGGGYKNIQLFNIEFKKLLIKVDNINDNIKLSINEKKLRIKKLFNQFEKKIKTQVNKMKKETTNAIKLLKLTKLKKSKPKSRKKTVSKSKPKPRKKTVSKSKKK